MTQNKHKRLAFYATQTTYFAKHGCYWQDNRAFVKLIRMPPLLITSNEFVQL